MPTTAEKRTRKAEDGTDQEVFAVEFTNGALGQLEDLKKFFEADDLLEVVQVGISYLQRVKETTEARQKIAEGSARKKTGSEEK